jgi:AraC-like DNA-binding protein
MGNTNQETWTAARRMKAYIAAHIREPITAKALADAAGYSQYHAARVFKQHTGRTPFEYIREQRLFNAALALRNGSAKIVDVAFDFVFDSHEGFTRAFVNAFGITPKKYAKFPKPDGWLVPYRFLDRQKLKTEDCVMETKTAVIFTQIMERPARKLILRRSKSATHYFEYVGEFGCDEESDTGATAPWTILCGVKEAIYEPVGVWLPDNMRPDGTGIYAHGVEVPVDYKGEIPEGFDVIDLAACKMLVFQGEPYDDEYFQDAVGACMERIKSFNPEVYGYEYADELAPRMHLEPWGWRGYIEMRPVREMKKQGK